MFMICRLKQFLEPGQTLRIRKLQFGGPGGLGAREPGGARGQGARGDKEQGGQVVGGPVARGARD